MPISLTKRAVTAIYGAVDKLFDKLKARFLGPQSVDKKIVFAVKPEYTLRGLFEASARAEGMKPNEEVLGTVMNVADNYLEAYRDVCKAKVVKEVQSFLHEAETTGTKTDVATVLGGKLSEVYKDVSDSVSKVIESETNTAKNMSALDGIVKINAYNGVSDPVVYFAVVRDEHLCKECKRLHLMGDGHTPRLWLLSEVGHSYHKRGESNPKFAGLHPNCRCSLCNVPPGYGFDAAGALEYKRPGYNALEIQRKTQKAEPYIHHGECSYGCLEKTGQSGEGDEEIWWHGTPSGDLRGGLTGLHLGTRRAAEEALHSRIGVPVEGVWDGTREYGKTLLAGRKTLEARRIPITGYNCDAPEEDHYPTIGNAKFSDSTPVLATHKPDIIGVRLVGSMANSRFRPHPDFKANGYVAGQLKRGTAKNGYYYVNEGEDVGSISVVVPGPGHVSKIERNAVLSDALSGAKGLGENDVNKSLKSAAAALTMGLSLAALPGKLSAPPTPERQAATVEKPVAPVEEPKVPEKWTPKNLHPELHPIAHLESSFGKFTEHTPHSKGELHTAIGAVGLKPITAHEEYLRTPALREAFPGLESPESFLEEIKGNHDLYNRAASAHWERLKRVLGTAEKAAYGWRWGVGAAKKADDVKVQEDPYVVKFRDLLASVKV